MKACFMFSISLKNIVLEEEISLAWDIRLSITAFLYLKGHSFLKLRVQELLLEGFFLSRGSEVIIVVSINENI